LEKGCDHSNEGVESKGCVGCGGDWVGREKEGEKKVQKGSLGKGKRMLIIRDEF